MTGEKGVVLGMPDESGTTVIGLISDTHGLLRPETLRAFQDATGIIHIGDVGQPEILESLVVTIGNVRAYMYHGHEAPKREPAEASCQVVVSGHSHNPKCETRDKILYLNPGSAGPRRFKLPVTLMRFNVNGSDISAELIYLL